MLGNLLSQKAVFATDNPVLDDDYHGKDEKQQGEDADADGYQLRRPVNRSAGLPFFMPGECKHQELRS